MNAVLGVAAPQIFDGSHFCFGRIIKHNSVYQQPAKVMRVYSVLAATISACLRIY